MAPPKLQKPPTDKAGGTADRDAHQHRVLTNLFIQALEDRQSREQRPQEAASPQALAEAAYEKLHFDWPVLTASELQALEGVLRESLDQKGCVVTPPLTTQLISNATHAALSAAKHLTPATGQQQRAAGSLQGVASGPDVGQGQQDQGLARDHSNGDALPSAASLSLLEVTDSTHPGLAAAYQRLSAVLLFDCVQNLLQLTRSDLCAALADYTPPDLTSHYPSNQPHSASATTGAVALLRQALEQPAPADGAPGAPDRDHAHVPQGHAPVCDVYAAESDDDDTVYEPLENTNATTQQPSTQQGRGSYSQAEGRFSTRGVQTAGTGLTAGHCDGRGSQSGMISWRRGPSDTGLGFTQGDSFPDWDTARDRLRHMTRQGHLAALTVPIPHTHNTQGSHTGSPLSSAAAQGIAEPRKAKALVLNGAATARKPVPPAGPDTRGGGGGSGGVCLWDDDGCVAGLCRTIRLLGVHDARGELLGVLQGYVDVAVDWAAAAQPGRTEYILSEVWSALGALTPPQHSTASATARTQRPMGSSNALWAQVTVGGHSPAPATLLPETYLALSMVTQLATKVSNNAAAKGALWRAVHTHLLPVCERALTDIARVAKPLLTQSSTAGTGANSGAVQQSAQYPRDLCAALETTCQVITFYIESRPGSADIATSLQSSGVLRALCATFATLATPAALPPTAAIAPAVDSLRIALLLACAASPATLTWCLAVPGVQRTVGESVAAAAQAAAVAAAAVPADAAAAATAATAAHGVVWQLLSVAQTQQQLKQPAANTQPAAQLSTASHSPVLVTLLRGVAMCDRDGTVVSESQMHLLTDSLQLLARAQRCAPRTQRISIPHDTHTSMLSALTHLKTRLQTTPQRTSSAGQAANAPGTTPSPASVDHSSESVRMCDIESVKESEESDDRARGLVSLHTLQLRRLESECVTALKELVSVGGGKSD